MKTLERGINSIHWVAKGTEKTLVMSDVLASIQRNVVITFSRHSQQTTLLNLFSLDKFPSCAVYLLWNLKQLNSI